MSVETEESTDTKLLNVGTSSRPNLKAKTEEHELMIDSGCFGRVCLPWFAPQFPIVSSTNGEAVAANNVALQHYGQKWFTDM